MRGVAYLTVALLMRRNSTVLSFTSYQSPFVRNVGLENPLTLFYVQKKHISSKSCKPEKRTRQPEVDEIKRSTHVQRTISRSSFLSFAATSAIAAVVAPSLVGASDSPKSIYADVNRCPKQDSYASSTELLSSSQSGTLEESISGFVAGAALTVTKTVVKYPLDTVAVRLQMPGASYSIADFGALFEGSLRGISGPLVSNIPAGAVFFALKDATKASLKGSDLPRWATTSISVAVAQLPYWLIRNPSEVVKTRQQAGIEGYGEGVSVLDAFKFALSRSDDGKTGGIGELYKGYWENNIYAFPADVIKFLAYENLSNGKKNLPPSQAAVYGALSTGFAQLVTTPLDVVRNRIMVSEKTSPTNSTSAIGKNSYLEGLAKLGREEGLDGLFAGASPRVGKAILSGAIQFATYEETKQEIGKWFERR